eukprot:2707303-Alexandrium_andersonii.AAC.3
MREFRRESEAVQRPLRAAMLNALKPAVNEGALRRAAPRGNRCARRPVEIPRPTFHRAALNAQR